MSATIYRTVNGVKTQLTNKQIKQYIKNVNGWTDEQYNKQYDILRNKLRTYETYQRQQGKSVETQSPQKILYFDARAKKTYGADYTPTAERQRLQSFPSQSTGKTLSAKQTQRFGALYTSSTLKAFDKFISVNPTAQRIVDTIDNPVKREQALKDLAKKVHARIQEDGKSAIPYGQAFGSSDEIEFDLDPYK